MSDWKPKRFWDKAHVVLGKAGYGVSLDARPVRTPAKAQLILPTEALAQAIADEWDAQTDVVDPGQMPMTRSANSAIDKIGPQRAAVIDMLAAYGDSDLLCYRATGPDALVARQKAGWDPLLDWAAQVLQVRLAVAAGVMHVPQDPAALDRLHDQLGQFDNFALAAVHDLVALSGSLILALAITQNHLKVEDVWDMSRIDEDWQIEQWGYDAAAAQAADVRRSAFTDAARFYRFSIG